MPTKSVSNEDILELLQETMQITGEGFEKLEKRMGGLEGQMGSLEGQMGSLEGRMNGLEGRMGGLEGQMEKLEGRMGRLETQYHELKTTVDKIANEQTAQKNDIKEILDRLLAIERRLPNITELEVREMQAKLQALVDWAVKAARTNKISLKLPR